MAPDLRAACERVRALLESASRDEVHARHEVGTVVRDIKRAPDRYGTRGVEKLAGALRLNVRTLYRGAAVAECWSAGEADALSRRADARGRLLSWSHLVLLAGVADADERAELIALTLARALSVRSLAALVCADAGDGDDTARVLLNRLVARLGRQSRLVSEAQCDLLDALEGAPGWDREAVAIVEEALAARVEHRARGDADIEQLRAELRRMSSSISGAWLIAGALDQGGVRVAEAPKNPLADRGVAGDPDAAGIEDAHGVAPGATESCERLRGR